MTSDQPGWGGGAGCTNSCRPCLIFSHLPPLLLHVLRPASPCSMQVPGQAVPMHYDSPWFWGASRFTMPQWLLVVMEQSKLWEPAVVRQLQGVAYLHNWKGAE